LKNNYVRPNIEAQESYSRGRQNVEQQLRNIVERNYDQVKKEEPIFVPNQRFERYNRYVDI